MSNISSLREMAIFGGTVALGIGGGFIGSELGNTLGGISRIAPCSQVGAYLGLKLGEKYLGFNKYCNVIKQYLLAASFAAGLSYEASCSDLIQRGVHTLDNFSGSILYYTSLLLAISSGVTCIYAAYKTLELYRDEKRFIKKWDIDDKEIKVFQQGEKFEIELINHSTKEVKRIPYIPEDNINAKELVSRFKQCEVALEDDGSPIFSKPILKETLKDRLLIWRKTHIMGHSIEGELSLLRRTRDLVWRVLIKQSGKSIQLPFENIEFTDSCHEVYKSKY